MVLRAARAICVMLFGGASAHRILHRVASTDAVGATCEEDVPCPDCAKYRKDMRAFIFPPNFAMIKEAGEPYMVGKPKPDWTGRGLDVKERDTGKKRMYIQGSWKAWYDQKPGWQADAKKVIADSIESSLGVKIPCNAIETGNTYFSSGRTNIDAKITNQALWDTFECFYTPAFQRTPYCQDVVASGGIDEDSPLFFELEED